MPDQSAGGAAVMSFSTTLQRIATARVLSAKLAQVIEDSRRLVRRSQQIALAAYRPIHPIGGGSDVALIIAALSAAAVCPACLARKTGVPPDHVESALTAVAAGVQIITGPGRCHACLDAQATTYRLATSEGAPAAGTLRRPVAHAEALWRFLENHRGELFCTPCLALSLGATRRLDRAVIRVEASGALRHFGRCAACGKERLVCGLAS